MSEHERVWRDPADPTEKRDWDLPPSVHGESGAADLERADGSGGAEPEDRAPARPGVDESERRDWDLP